MNKLFQILLLFSGISHLATAEVTLPHFFSDGMVLQREKPIRIWGKADKKEKVTITFKGIQKEVIAGKDNRWEAEFPAMPHGGPYSMVVSGKSNAVTFSDILIGDVWLCSGQSNMEWGVNGDLTAKEAIPAANYPDIRLLTIPKTIQTKEQFDTEPTQWVICTPETVSSFSAVSYFFGKKLHEDLDVPIGLINSSWGGTDIETWTSWKATMNNPNYTKYQGKTLEKALGYNMEDVRRFEEAMKSEKDIEEGWYKPSYKGKGWIKKEAPGAWDKELEFEDGIIWFRKEIELPASANGKEGVLHLGSIDDEDITWVNGTEVGRIAFWMAGRNYTIKPGILKEGKNLITVRIKDTGSVGGMTGSPESVYLQVGDRKYPLAGEWEYKPYVLSSTFNFQSHGSGPNSFASLLYNGMIHPLAGYGIKGVIWYQGENNASQATLYQTLFPNLINDWREKWNDEFPFLWVQLAGFMAEDNEPAERSEWAELREAQDMALQLPKTGQAVIADLGEAFDIHPRNKKDVSHRLAHIALNVAYGKPVLSSGPVLNKIEKKEGRLILSFSQTGEGLTTSDKNKYNYVRGFAIAGKDQKFVWAQAYILNNRVVVFSDRVPEPVYVRYGWANNNIDINLANNEGLIASPFRAKAE